MDQQVHSDARNDGEELTSASWAALRAQAEAGTGPGHCPSSRQAIGAPYAERCGALYAPLARSPAFVLAQVGQSLDGRVATVDGDARNISGAAGLRHLHRCRALVDAIVVGVGTVVADDPSLTVRLVEGRNPVRVVIDPRGRIPRQARLLHDAAAPVLLVHGPNARVDDLTVPCLALPMDDAGRIEAPAIVQALAARGLRRVLVEGGACTIASFLEAGCLDRLHVAIAPLIIGAGPTGLALPPVSSLAQARRPRTTSYDLGGDVVFDCELREAPMS